MILQLKLSTVLDYLYFAFKTCLNRDLSYLLMESITFEAHNAFRQS